MALTGPIVYSKLARQSIDEGYLSDIEVRILDSTKPSVLGDLPLSWQQEYEYGVVRNESRNQKIVYKAKDHFLNGDRVFILVRMIEHGKILQRMLSQVHNIPSIFLSGISATWKREEVKKQFNDEGNFVMVASSIFSEGVDIPEINVFIKAKAGQAESEVIQEIGRGLRKKKDGGKLTVYDFNDLGWKYLTKHSKKREKIYRKEGYL
jgi:superfamily II DNA or RNA helicase